jgi:hypothetical protein
VDLRLELAYLELLRSYFLLLYGRIVQPVRMCPRVRRVSNKLSMARRISNRLQGFPLVRLPDVLCRRILWDVENRIIIGETGHR